MDKKSGGIKYSLTPVYFNKDVREHMMEGMHLKLMKALKCTTLGGKSVNGVYGIYGICLIPRPFLQGRGKMAWAPLLAHARRSHKNMGIRARLYIVRLHISNLP